MSKKDYVLIAAVLAETASEYAGPVTVSDVTFDAAHRFADRLANDNPRFDRGRFLTACGVPATRQKP